MVLTRDGDILLRKTAKESFEDIAHEIEKTTEETFDIDTIVAEAVDGQENQSNAGGYAILQVNVAKRLCLNLTNSLGNILFLPML